MHMLASAPIAGEYGEEILQGIDFTAGHNFGGT
jgi:hypothetical protein